MSEETNLTVIIRQAGERTTELCHRIVLEQVPSEQVFLVNEQPFWKAVEKTYNIGLEQGKRWTLAVDADVLLRKEAISDLIGNAEAILNQKGSNLVVYHGNLLCRIFGNPRTVGFHLYNSECLPSLLEFLKQTKETIRPESGTYKLMYEKGFYHYIDDKVYGLHAYEQSYLDMFKNGFFQANKHHKYFDQFMKFWRENIDQKDYEVLFQGWIEGLKYKGELEVSKTFFESSIKNAFQKLFIAEKEPLESLDTSEFDHLISSELSENNYPLKPWQLPKVPDSRVKILKGKIGGKLIQIGKSLNK